MSGSSGKLTRKQELAVAALLTQPTIAAAAEEVSVGVATLRRWMERDDFQRAFTAARREVLNRALTSINDAAGDAVIALRRNTSCGKPSVEVAAARALLDLALRSFAALELEERIGALEAATQPKSEGGPR